VDAPEGLPDVDVEPVGFVVVPVFVVAGVEVVPVVVVPVPVPEVEAAGVELPVKQFVAGNIRMRL